MGFYSGAKYRYYDPRPSRFPFDMRLSSETICAYASGAVVRHITYCILFFIVCVCTWELLVIAVIVRRTPGRRRRGPPVKLTVKLRDRCPRRTPFTLFLFTDDVHFSFRIFTQFFVFFFPSPGTYDMSPVTNRARAIDLHISPGRRSN